MNLLFPWEFHLGPVRYRGEMKNRGFLVDFGAGENPKIVGRFQNVRLMRRMSGSFYVDPTVIATNTFSVCHRLHPER